jgi:carbonic anhydrase/acetyltransferase-like protein (isoleucine patch superfamily)
VLRSYRGQFPRVDPTAFVDASAQVVGDVEIGEQSSVWMCAVIRGDVHSIRVGKRAEIQLYADRYVGYRLEYMDAR